MVDGKIDNQENISVSAEEIASTIKSLEDFVSLSKDFKLNPEKDRVNSLVKGILNNQKRYGLKFCPCRIQTKIRERDLKLVCPCNFKAQKTWQEKGECWCSLFVKKS